MAGIEVLGLLSGIPIASFSPSAYSEVDWPNVGDHELQATDVPSSPGPASYTAILPASSSQHEYTSQKDDSQCNISSKTSLRARSLPTIEWEHLRSVIRHIYIDEGRQLEDVAREMRELYSVDATAQMYKKKFALWGIRKNHSRQQRKEVSIRPERSKMPLVQESQQTASTALTKKRGKSRKFERYRRPWDQHRVRGREMKLSFLHLRHSPEFHSVEIVLLETAYYSNWCFSQLDPDAKLGHNLKGDEVFHYIASGRDSLHTDTRQAFAMFNKACASVPRLLQGQSLPTVYQFLDVFGDAEWWDGHADARMMLLRDICSMAWGALGPLHPVSKIMSILAKQMSWTHLLPQAGRLLLDITTQHGHDATDAGLWFQMSVVSACYMGPGELDLAAKEILRLSRQIKSNLSRSHRLLQKAKHELAGIYSVQGDFLAAEQEWLEVLELCAEQTGRRNASAVSVRSCWRLGRLYAREGRDADAERCFTLAVEGAFYGWGADALAHWNT